MDWQATIEERGKLITFRALTGVYKAVPWSAIARTGSNQVRVGPAGVSRSG